MDMTKQVLVAISGLQFIEGNDEEPLEVITAGDYYLKNNKHYVIYDEVMEGFSGTTKNVIKFQDNMLDITKKGVTNVHMVFEENKKNVTYYGTPFGTLLIGIMAKNVEVEESPENIEVKVDYTLEVNYEFVADCKIKLNVKSKEAKDFTLQTM